MGNQLSGLLDQIENFLFDLLGIVLPGFIFLIMLLTPVVLISLPTTVVEFHQTEFVKFVQGIAEWIKVQEFTNSFYWLLLASFILGHVVKVFSKVWYELLKAIFDDTVNVLWMKIVVKSGITKARFNSKKGINPIFYFITKQLSTIFTFSSPNYYPENEELKNESIVTFNKYFDSKFQERVWYSLYKLTKIVNTHEHAKSLAYTYLAKYNLYRSLSFIVMFNLIFDLIIVTHIKSINGDVLFNVTAWVIAANAIFWFTYHDKYKRYWTLCGDESLMAFYYFTLRKKKEINGDN